MDGRTVDGRFYRLACFYHPFIFAFAWCLPTTTDNWQPTRNALRCLHRRSQRPTNMRAYWRWHGLKNCAHTHALRCLPPAYGFTALFATWRTCKRASATCVNFSTCIHRRRAARLTPPLLPSLTFAGSSRTCGALAYFLWRAIKRQARALHTQTLFSLCRAPLKR